MKYAFYIYNVAKQIGKQWYIPSVPIGCFRLSLYSSDY